MGRASLLIGLLLLLAALSLVTARYQARLLFIHNEQLLSHSQELDVAWRQLQLERAELSRNARVDQIARGTLRMVPIAPSRTVYIRDTVIAQDLASSVGGAN
jgi:cell division protein FtsL